MRIIDSRSGQDVKVGDVMDYTYPGFFMIGHDGARPNPDDCRCPIPPQVRQNPRPEWWKLLAVKDRFFTAKALVEYHQVDGETWIKWVPLKVRFTHPQFRDQRVAFAPT